MSKAILTPAQQAVLERLSRLPTTGTFYMAGGTALALQLEHRRSIDFDFFRTEGFEPPELLNALGLELECRVRRTERDTLTVEIAGVSTSFFAYPYALLTKPRPFRGQVRLAAPLDIAAMKIAAIASRGPREDFVDLYVACTESLTLWEAMSAFERKFGEVPYERYHVLKSLTYFDDAEAELMPEMLN